MTVDAFIIAACVPRHSSHASGRVEAADAMLAKDPGIAAASIHVAAILGDDAGVRRWIALDPASATAKGGPYGWDALTHLCFSNYLKLSPGRSDGFVRAAKALLDAGASANGGWLEDAHDPKPTWESVLYGAAGVAHHPGVTGLLLEHGADPNDDETPYHTPETDDNRCMALLVETGRMTEDNLSMMLVRKHDWHDFDGAKYLLEHGANPNLVRNRGWSPIHHAISRDNRIEFIALLLEHGADPMVINGGQTAVVRAAQRGRGDIITLFARHGTVIDLPGVDGLLVACALHDREWIDAIATHHPSVVAETLVQGAERLAQFAGTRNTAGLGDLLDLGVPVNARYGGESYFGTPPDSTALHVAAWRGVAETVKFLISRGADVNACDGNGMTPLQLAVRATVDSHWTYRRTPEAVAALLEAGASTLGVPYPCGYAEVDLLLAERGAAGPR